MGAMILVDITVLDQQLGLECLIPDTWFRRNLTALSYGMRTR